MPHLFSVLSAPPPSPPHHSLTFFVFFFFSLSLFMYLCIYISLSLCLCLSVYLSDYLSIHLSLSLYLCLLVIVPPSGLESGQLAQDPPQWVAKKREASTNVLAIGWPSIFWLMVLFCLYTVC